MHILLVNLARDTLQLDIYKLYRNKKIVHELLVNISNLNNKDAKFSIINSNNVTLVNKKIKSKAEESIEEYLKYAFQHEKLIKYEFNYTVNKIMDGAMQYTDITLSHDQTIANLLKINNSPEQKLQLHIAKYIHQRYKVAKHYLCFETGFYKTVNHNLQTSTGFSINNNLGLYLSAITNKLGQYSLKAKKTWLILTIEAQYTIFTIIKKQECLTSNILNCILLDSDTGILEKNNYLKISTAITTMLTSINDVHGIVICGALGVSNSKIRKSILKPLEWAGITLNTKSTNYLISKKSSILPILCINSQENSAILNQLTSRI